MIPVLTSRQERGCVAAFAACGLKMICVTQLELKNGSSLTVLVTLPRNGIN